ncbi:MAG TPA: cupredoxin domain-containing protein [Solirubrobacteraceae bacterium]|nr:cupredoxin domain-containing protein [Solirubrobacteraceae bacterium]
MPLSPVRGASATAAVIAALAVGACGDDSGDGSSGTPGLGQVFETEYEINPQNLPVQRGTKATLTVNNNGGVVHALEVEGPTGEFKTGSIQPGKSAKLTVDATKAGKYTYYCPIDSHRQKGMQGSITVATAGTGGGGGAATSGGTSNGY